MTIQGIIFDLDGTLVDTLDDLTDSMNAALAAGLRCIGCEWGFRSKTQLLAASADILIQHPAQIFDTLA